MKTLNIGITEDAHAVLVAYKEKHGFTNMDTALDHFLLTFKKEVITA